MVFTVTSLQGLFNKTVWLKKKRTLQEFARSMLDEYDLPKYFWAEAVNTTCYVSNRVLIRYSYKTYHEVYHNKIPNIGYFKVFFCCKCFILNNKQK